MDARVKPAHDKVKTHVRSETYRERGVETAEADAGLNRIIARVQKTWPAAGLGRLVLPIGYFANVIELDGIGLALCTDGVVFFQAEDGIRDLTVTGVQTCALPI